jgi:antitoxin component of MazEF toxin-antitoxin module
MSMVTIRAKLLRWGNSYGLRLSRGDVERLHLRPDTTVEMRLDVTPGEKIRATEAVSFRLGGDAAARHDELFAKAALEEHRESTTDEHDADSP